MSNPEKRTALFGRVAQLVRGARAQEAPPEASESLQQAEAGKEALRRMLERKRHNDAIREREFNALRKILKAEVAVKKGSSEQDSIMREATAYSDFDERAQTLKKIDDIESQMSRQWWKVQAGSGATKQAPLEAGSSILPLQTAPGWQLDAQDDFPPTLVLGKPDDGTLGLEFDGLDDLHSIGGSVHSAFSESKMVSVERGQTLSDPVLADVAVLFAQGDDAGTEKALLSALRGPDSKPEVVEPWAGALFDFYRCLNKQQAFEQFAHEHEARFGRQAPRWDAFASSAADGVAGGEPLEALSTLQMTAHEAESLTDSSAGGSPLPTPQRPAKAKACGELKGEIIGDCDAMLESINSQYPGSGPLVVSCAELVRADFAAAGSILNWSAHAKAAGIDIELRKVSRLVAAFFLLIGINEYALIRTRSD